MKIFIDLGAFNGDTVLVAIRMYPDIGKIYAFEPDPTNYRQMLENIGHLKNVEFINAAASDHEGEATFYHHKDHGKRTDALEGGTLAEGKNNIDRDNSIKVRVIDFSNFLVTNVSEDDEVILKIDIEGSEYDLLEKLISTHAIKLIDKLYCEWHEHKVRIAPGRHGKVVASLKALGFDVTGSNDHDEFSQLKRDIDLTIVIATYNRSKVLESLLQSLAEQTDKNFEVVVSVDGSTDNTMEMLENFKKNSSFPLRYVNTGLTNVYGLATARNMGIKEASGEAVVVIDDDSFPVPEFVSEHKRTVMKNTLTGGARLSDKGEDNLEEKNRLYLETYGDSIPRDIIPIPKYKWIVENNTCMFKDDWLRSGLFDESIKAYGGIGQKFNEEIIKKGFMYQFNPKASIVHRTEFKQNHLYKRVKRSRVKEKSVAILKHYFPKSFAKVKRLLQG